MLGRAFKVNTRALGRGALHKKGDSIPLLLTSERHTGRACRRPFTRSVLTIQYPNHIYTKPLLPNDSPVSRTEYVPQTTHSTVSVAAPSELLDHTLGCKICNICGIFLEYSVQTDADQKYRLSSLAYPDSGPHSVRQDTKPSAKPMSL